MSIKRRNSKPAEKREARPLSRKKLFPPTEKFFGQFFFDRNEAGVVGWGVEFFSKFYRNNK
jgi:hypothetical protein